METILRDAAERVYLEAADLFPQVVLAILVVVGGLAVASILYHLCVRVLAVFAIDKLAGKTPIERTLKNMGLKKSISQILALLVFWLTLLVTLIFASELLHLKPVAQALVIITRYIPQVIAALLIVFFGMLLAKFLQSLTAQSLSRVELGHERVAGKAVYTIILAFVFVAAIQQLGFDLSFLTANMLLIVFIFFVILGAGLIVASRSLLENMIACYELHSSMKKGDRVEVAGHKGTVREFTMTSVILDADGKKIVLPARLFFTETYTIL